MKPIQNWKQCWRMLSVQAMTLAGAIQGAWLFVPEDMKSTIPPNVVQWTTLALLGLGVAGRLVKQQKVNT
jgi:type IV secretory pathway TrbF-like protein